MNRRIAIAMVAAAFAACGWYSDASAQMNSAPAVSLNQQKTTLTLTFPGGPRATVDLDAAQVEKMIATLAQMRADMNPSRPLAEPAPGSTMNIATAGRWFVQPDGAGIDLAILHPGYGWVGLQLAPASIEELNRRLSRSVRRAPTRQRHSSER